MARVRVPQQDGHVTVFEGGDATPYAVKDGVVDVADAHLAAVLSAVPGSSDLTPRPEAPAKGASKPAGPAKENQ